MSHHLQLPRELDRAVREGRLASWRKTGPNFTCRSGCGFTRCMSRLDVRDFLRSGLSLEQHAHAYH